MPDAGLRFGHTSNICETKYEGVELDPSHCTRMRYASIMNILRTDLWIHT